MKHSGLYKSALLFTLLTLNAPSFSMHETESGSGIVPFDHWRSGEPVPVGSDDRRGPIEPGVTFWPLGNVYLSGAATSDMFMATDRFSHPSSILLYRSAGRDESGTPVYHAPERVDAPFGPNDGAIVLQDDSKAIHGVWFKKGALHFSRFDESKMAFEEVGKPLPVPELERAPENIRAIPLDSGVNKGPLSGRWMFLFSLSDGSPKRPVGPSWREADYRPYDAKGIYRGSLVKYTFSAKVFDSGTEEQWLGKVSPGEFATMMTCDAVANVKLGNDKEGLVAGTILGGMYYFPATRTNDGIVYTKKLRIVDSNGNAIRHPSVHAYVSAHHNEETGFDDLLVGTQGFATYYKFTGRFSENGEPIFGEAQNVLVENAGLQLGALTVPNIVDWDQDGKLDLIAGNSDGYVMFSRNIGTNQEPRLLPGVRVQAGGKDIHVQPGYYDIQGPNEARWGYSCPTTVDWDGDGDMDIVMSDPTAAHTIFLNQAGPGKPPELAAGSHLYWEHLDLHGTWRVRPAAGQLDDGMGYVILDGDNELHLYWRLDDYNVDDGGKLRFQDGSTIPGAYLSAGGTGRLKLLLHDWDGDGVKDIITGTSRHASVGSRETGLPQALGRPGSSVLWLRNAGTNSEPLLEKPRVMSYQGEPIFFGQHSCAPAIGPLGPGGEENIVVGTEDGRIWFFEREDIRFLSMDEFQEANSSVVFDRICANPESVSDNKGEWFSLRNVSDKEVDISDHWFYSRGARQRLNSYGSLVLAPGESLIVGRSLDPSENGGVKVDLLLDNSISLSNNAGIIGLYSDRGVHDAIRWGDGSEKLLNSEVSSKGMIHGVAPELCRLIGSSMNSGEVRNISPAEEQ